MSRVERVYHVVWLGRTGSFATANAVFNAKKNWARIPESQIAYYDNDKQHFLVSETEDTINVATAEDAGNLQVLADGSVNVTHDPSEDADDDDKDADAGDAGDESTPADEDTQPVDDDTPPTDEHASNDVSEQDATSDTEKVETKVTTTPARVKKSKK